MPSGSHAREGSHETHRTIRLLSFLLPSGAGQFHNEDVTKGVVMLVGTVPFVAFAIDGIQFLGVAVWAG